MPFISKDWRSPGEEWVKTEEGWEKKKILECGRQFSINQQENLDGRCSESYGASDVSGYDGMSNRWLQDDEDKENISEVTDIQGYPERMKNTDNQVLQPHCHITIKCTREIAGFNGLSDAFKRLDFRSAVHDVRRFNYICKLLDLLISHKLTALSGCAQKVLFNMLEEVAYQVSASQQNIHLLNKLLRQLRSMIDCACWGRPLGSTQLWENHLVTINRILGIANRIQIREPGDEVFPKLENLPEECVREVLLRLADHKDLEASGKAYSVMARLCDEQRIWRELCQFHFSSQQIAFILDQQSGPTDWQSIYHKLRNTIACSLDTLQQDYPTRLNVLTILVGALTHTCSYQIRKHDHQISIEEVSDGERCKKKSSVWSKKKKFFTDMQLVKESDADDLHNSMRMVKMSMAKIFVTTSPCREWVICAPAAFLGIIEKKGHLDCVKSMQR